MGGETFEDQFEPIELLGSGSFGKVHKVRSRKDGRIYACKEIEYTKMSSKEVSLLQSEVINLRRMSHPHIIAYYSTIHDQDASVVFIINEYCGKGDLTKYIRTYRQKKENIPEATIWNMFHQMALALEYCHSPNKPGFKPGEIVIHRDIKPANVLITDDDQLKLADFGFCRTIGLDTMAQTKAGSPVYCAPEVLREEDYNEKADIWSLGCVIYELCCVEYAYSSINEKFLLISMMQQKRKPIPSCYSRDLAEVIERMLQVDFKKRPSATELLAHPKFKEYNLTRGSSKSPAPAAARNPAPSGKHSATGNTPSQSPQPGAAAARNAASLGRVSTSPERPVPAAAGQYGSNLTAPPSRGAVAATPTVPVNANKGSSKDSGQLHDVIVRQKKEIDELKARVSSGSTAHGISENARNTIVKASDEIKKKDDEIIRLSDTVFSKEEENAALRREIAAYEKFTTTVLMPRPGENPLADGVTRLMLAAQKGLTAVVQHLLSQEIGLRSASGKTALMYAAENGQNACVRLLMDKEGGMQDNKGTTALMRASIGGRFETCKILFARESGMQSQEGDTALTYATIRGNTEIIRLLAPREAGLQLKDGKTALMSAASRGFLEAVKILYDKEGKLVDKNGRDALYYAQQKNLGDIVAFLQSKK